ncbi:hypothetical protein BRD17_06400 [Halobacteriales archaeon SW_7_68_16]|nr:MAG: hypothetical protein BRD17_06400 [Halobacteriales archaeon SW_7_68_16]
MTEELTQTDIIDALDELRDRVNDLKERVDSIETTVNEHDDTIDDHESILTATNGNVEALFGRSNDQEERLNDLRGDIDALDDTMQRLSRHIEDIEISVDIAVDLSELERILLGVDPEPDTVSAKRAVTIAQHWRDIAGSVGISGATGIDVADTRVKSKLEYWRNESLNHKQVHRALDELVEMSGGKLVEKETEGKKRVLIEDEDSELFLSREEVRDAAE